MECKKWLLATSRSVKSHPLSHFLHCAPATHLRTGRTPRAAWYNQKRDIESNPLTLGKLKKVYFLFANSCGMVQTLHKSELDDTTHKPIHPMNANIETAALAEVADALGFSLEIIAGPTVAVEPADSKDSKPWVHIAYSVRLLRNGREVITTPYKLGSGHVPKGALLAVRNVTNHEQLCQNTIGRNYTPHHEAPGYLSLLEKAARLAKVVPTLAGVLHSLVLDGAAYFDAETFEDWAGNYGYDTDSRKAKVIWRACDETGRKLARVLSADDIATLREAAANH